MIRRKIRLADGQAGWMLISQIEHARISALLASRCAAQLSGEPPSTDVRDEMLAAIAHHDDGWAEWEQAPQLDGAGRPLSFMEVDANAALTIWSKSVDAAEEIGPLAAWMVAGHFARLASHSQDDADDPSRTAWIADAERRRREWLTAWQAAEPSRRTEAVAEAALQWLWTFDEASLWLCCTSSSGGSFGESTSGAFRAGAQTPLAMDWRVVGAGADMGPAVATATVAPWRFHRGEHAVVIAGKALIAEDYAQPSDLLTAASPATVAWRLEPTS